MIPEQRSGVSLVHPPPRWRARMVDIRARLTRLIPGKSAEPFHRGNGGISVPVFCGRCGLGRCFLGVGQVFSSQEGVRLRHVSRSCRRVCSPPRGGFFSRSSLQGRVWFPLSAVSCSFFYPSDGTCIFLRAGRPRRLIPRRLRHRFPRRFLRMFHAAAGGAASAFALCLPGVPARGA